MSLRLLLLSSFIALLTLGCMLGEEGDSCIESIDCEGALLCDNGVCTDSLNAGDYGSGDLGSGCGTSSYGGPYYDDYQVESQCEALYAYECSDEATESICEILDQWERNGVPNVCPYC